MHHTKLNASTLVALYFFSFSVRDHPIYTTGFSWLLLFSCNNTPPIDSLHASVTNIHLLLGSVKC